MEKPDKAQIRLKGEGPWMDVSDLMTSLEFTEEADPSDISSFDSEGWMPHSVSWGSFEAPDGTCAPLPVGTKIRVYPRGRSWWTRLKARLFRRVFFYDLTVTTDEPANDDGFWPEYVTAEEGDNPSSIFDMKRED